MVGENKGTGVLQGDDMEGLVVVVVRFVVARRRYFTIPLTLLYCMYCTV